MPAKPNLPKYINKVNYLLSTKYEPSDD